MAHIPRFGEWEEANEMPITQYFENPKQAGLLRHHDISTSHSSSTITSSSSSAEPLMLASHHPRPRDQLHPSRQTAGTKDKRVPQRRRVRDFSAQTEKSYIDVNGVKKFQNNVAPASKPPKPVDEDLYKIPPELLHSSTRKRTPGFLSCLIPCAT